MPSQPGPIKPVLSSPQLSDRVPLAEFRFPDVDLSSDNLPLEAIDLFEYGATSASVQVVNTSPDVADSAFNDGASGVVCEVQVSNVRSDGFELLEASSVVNGAELLQIATLPAVRFLRVWPKRVLADARGLVIIVLARDAGGARVPDA